MILLCIKDSPDIAYTKNGPICISDNLRVKCGHLYTAIKEVIGYKNEKKWVLKEKPSNCRYKKEYFSLIEENEETQESEKELIYSH